MKASIGFRISFQKVESFALFCNTQCSFPRTNELLFIMAVFSSAYITVIIVFIIDGMVDVIFFLPLFLLHIVKIVHLFYFSFFFQLLPDLIYQNLMAHCIPSFLQRNLVCIFRFTSAKSVAKFLFRCFTRLVEKIPVLLF